MHTQLLLGMEDHVHTPPTIQYWVLHGSKSVEKEKPETIKIMYCWLQLNDVYHTRNFNGLFILPFCMQLLCLIASYIVFTILLCASIIIKSFH